MSGITFELLMPMLRVSEHFEIALAFNGLQYPLAPATIETVEMIENLKNTLPTLHFKLKDSTGALLDNWAIGDGTKVSVAIGDGTGTRNETYDFRLFSVTGHPQGDFQMVEGYGTLDAPNYLRSVAKGSFPGTSGDAISKLAGQAGLKPVVDQFSDKMTWLPLHQHINEFVHKIADHGYAGTNGITSVGVDLLGNLHYRNLAQVIQQGVKKKFIYGPSSNAGEQALHYQIKNFGGALNNFAGYNAVTHQLNLEGIIESFSQVQIPQLSSFMNMASGVKQALGDMKIQYAPIDAGNVHKKYTEAQHTNMRGRASFGVNVYIYTDIITHLHLYDMVEIELYNNAGYRTVPKINKTYSGKYMISGRNLTVSTNKFVEKLELSTQGTNGGGSGGFLGGDQ